MNEAEYQRIRTLSQSNFELKKLYERHRKLKEELSKLKNRPYLTVFEETRAKVIKFEKLRSKDRMKQILDLHQAA